MWKNLWILCDNIKVFTGIESKVRGGMAVSNDKGEIDRKILLHGMFPFVTSDTGARASIRAVAVQYGGLRADNAVYGLWCSSAPWNRARAPLETGCSRLRTLWCRS